MRRAAIGLIGLAITLLILGACSSAEEAEPTTAPAAQPPAATAAAVAEPTTAAPAAPPGETPQRGGNLRNRAPDDSGQGVAILSKANPEYRYTYSDSLVYFDNFGTIKPSLAESWDVSSDNKSITFNLRRDVTWHDGEPFTAKDVIFTLDKVADPETTTILKGLLTAGGEYITYSSPDDYTVTVQTSVPFAPINAGFSELLIIPEHLLRDTTDINTDPYNLKPVGTGGFIVTEWKRNEFIRMEANPNYHLGAPYLDEMTHIFFPDRDAAHAAVLAGSLDTMYAVPQEQPQHEREGTGTTIYNFPYWQAITLTFNQAHPAMKEKAVRQAISMAIESKEEWGNTVLRGRGPKADFFWTPGAPVAQFNPSIDEIPQHVFDLEGAKALLDQAGWTVGGDGIREKMIDGRLERLELPLPWELGEYGEGAEILDRYLQPLGVQLNIRKVDRSLRNDLRREPVQRHRERALEIYEWPHSMGGNNAGAFDPDLTGDVHSKNIEGGGSNSAAYSNPQVDRLLGEGVATFDVAQRREIYSQIQRLILEDFAAVPVYHAFDALAATERVKGITQDTPMAIYYQRRFGHLLWLEQ